VLLPLVLAASLLADQPIAPIAPGSPSGDPVPHVVAVEAAARTYIVAGASVTAVTDAGVQRVGRLPNPTRAVAVAGDDLLAVYVPTDSGATGQAIVTLHPDGTLGPERQLEGVDGADLAVSGDRVLVFSSAGAELLVLNTGGEILRRGITLTTVSALGVRALAGSNDTFLIAWTEEQILYARAVSRDGDFLSEPLRIAEEANWPALASDGGRFLLTWLSKGRIEGLRLTAHGEPLGEPVTIDAGPVAGSSPAVSWDGRRYLVAFEYEQDIYRVAVSRTGVAGSRELVAGGPKRQSEPSVAGPLIAWKSATPCLGAESAVALVPGRGETVVSIGDPARFAPRTAAVGETFATVWLDRTDELRVRLRVGDELVELSDSAALAMPAIASAGDRALVVWSENDDATCSGRLATALIDAEGRILARQLLDVRAFYFTAATDGSEFVLAWTLSIHNDMSSLNALRIGADGAPIGEPRQVAHERVPRFSSFYWAYPSLVWNGSEYLAVWQRSFAQTVMMMRLSRTADPIESPVIISDAFANPFPAAAAGSTGTLIVHRSPDGYHGILVEDHGAILARPHLAPGPLRALPAVAARGAEFLVIVNDDVIRVDANGTHGIVTTLPEAPPPGVPIPFRAIAASGARVQIAFVEGPQIFLRELSFARRRSVRR